MPKAKREDHTIQLPVRVTPTLKERMDRVAHEAGLSFSEWVRCALVRAVDAAEKRGRG